MDSFIVSARLMKHVALIVLWISVIVTGAFLRFDHLAKRPFHADEATGARITARRMESGGGHFDPKHYHGPLLADLAIPLCRLRGETRWQELTKSTLRMLPAIAGSLLVLLPLLWRRRFGDAPMLLAAALLASSPLLVYYSRMFIHESLLALFGMLALFALTRKPRWGITGFLIGLMFATKESFAISLIAWAGAGLLIALENRKSLDRAMWVSAWRQYRIPVGLSLLAFAVTACGFYTDGFRHPQGALDAVRTFFVYETVAGHDKPIGYYVQLLALPKKSGNVWWFETPRADPGVVRVCGHVPPLPGSGARTRHHPLHRLCRGRPFPDLQPHRLQDAVARVPAVGACLPVSRLRAGRILQSPPAAQSRSRRACGGLSRNAAPASTARHRALCFGRAQSLCLCPDPRRHRGSWKPWLPQLRTAAPGRRAGTCRGDRH